MINAIAIATVAAVFFITAALPHFRMTFRKGQGVGHRSNLGNCWIVWFTLCPLKA